jgi:L-malate glycosyltransferase
MVQIMNYLGQRFRHSVVALDGDFSASQRLSSDVAFEPISCERSRNPLLMTYTLRGLFAQRRPDLVLTYNWGSIDAVSAAAVPPAVSLIHSEDGFGPGEEVRQKQRRVLFRRMLLPRAYRVIVPSSGLSEIARKVWRLPAQKVLTIFNAVDTDRFRPPKQRSSGPTVVVGAACFLRPEKQIGSLIRMFSDVARGRNMRLRIAGDGQERQPLERLTHDLDMQGQVEFLGHLNNLTDFYQGLDLFAMTSSTEQMPVALLEAMSSGLPVVSTDVGDIRDMVSEGNRQFVVSGIQHVRTALAMLTHDALLRARLGRENREQCIRSFRLTEMLRAYDVLYNSVPLAPLRP